MIVIVYLVFITVVYVALMLAFKVGMERSFQQKDKNVEKKVKLSVVISFRNEAENLPTLLDSISMQTLSQDYFELILIDDHSSDNSLLVVEGFKPKFLNLKIFAASSDQIGKKTALIYGIKKASNPIIVFTDADCIPSRYWLESISICAANGTDFIIGTVIMNAKNGFADKIQALEYSSLMATAAGSSGIGLPVIASSANLAFRKDILNVEIDDLTPTVSSGDDMFLLHKAKRVKGCRIRFLSDERGVVQTKAESTIAKALKQRKRWTSKSIHYKDFDTIIAALVVLLFSMSIVGLFFASVLNVRYLFHLSILLAIKSFIDYTFIRRYLKNTGQDTLLNVFLPLQLVYPIYVTYSFFAGIFIKVSWKGRMIR